MTEQERTIIIDEFASEFAANKILGIYLYGSRADGTARAENF